MPDTKNEPSVLITCDAESEELLFEELRRTGIPSGIWLDTGDAVQGSILLVEDAGDFAEFAASLKGSLFARHLAPVEYELKLEGIEDDIETISELVPVLAARLKPDQTFSVQTRILGTGKLPYRKVVVNETLSKALEEATGAAMDCRRPQQIVSVLCSPEKAYLGLSTPEQNRSDWPGGKHRFKRDDDQVSRAEFKLLEALSVFGIELPTKGLALDIGASPGGWSRVLASCGLKVDAVDPGDLDPRLRRNKLISHYRKRIQEYSPGAKKFDAIVNDMKMDARDSIEIMIGFSGRLTPDGIAVITLKMPKSNASKTAVRKTLDMLREDLARLATAYQVLGARQLYHNRSEVTVALRSRQVS